MRQTQLFLLVHTATGGLLSVAQAGIENSDANSLGH
jgi:hypothetical protein